MKLPDREAAVVSEQKIVEYLLNPLHPEGSSKAEFFGSLILGVEALDTSCFSA